MSDHIPDATKMISDTPRTDAGLEYDDTTVDGVKEFARQLERELKKANQYINLINEAGDKMADLLRWQSRMDRTTSPSASAWRKAMEAKP